MKFADYIEPSHGIFSGRFQPVTAAHAKIIEKIGKENTRATIFLVKGKTSSKDKEKNPFNAEVQKRMLEMIAPKNVTVEVISTGFFIDRLNEMQDNKFIAYAGTDRVQNYEKYIKYMDEGKTLTVTEIERTDDDISASKVREALINNDKEAFKTLTNEKTHGMFEELKTILGD